MTPELNKTEGLPDAAEPDVTRRISAGAAEQSARQRGYPPILYLKLAMAQARQVPPMPSSFTRMVM